MGGARNIRQGIELLTGVLAECRAASELHSAELSAKSRNS
jgi:hypothetical protein